MRLGIAVLVLAGAGWCQEADRTAPVETQPVPPPPERAGRLFWIIPNSTTCPMMKEFKPITAREKFQIATRDAFDPGTFFLAGVFAGKGQLTNSDPSLGQGVAGYGRRYAAAYGDFAIADYMTEGVFPTILHQDNRYFRKATGGFLGRLGHAVGSTFVTYKDNGGRTFNFSELGGNAAAVAISTAYYPDSHFGGETVGRWGVQMGLDTVANVFKEFWPDMQGKITRKKGR